MPSIIQTPMKEALGALEETSHNFRACNSDCPSMERDN